VNAEQGMVGDCEMEVEGMAAALPALNLRLNEVNAVAIPVPVAVGVVMALGVLVAVLEAPSEPVAPGVMEGLAP
jgi:hypothetical protein